ncbi:MAG: tRNA pseudouridine(38-40) synthase TruA [Actinomycetota bacterium]|nr:tRNA pseudouridine(38-40) synthase TruA [Actinomycetota bacterium]
MPGDASPGPDAAARGPSARLLIEYDGTAFAGWASQLGQRTVQAELERALAVVLRRPAVGLKVAGRTDAGVHAWGQVASYQGQPAGVSALNALLPDDVAVIECRPADPGFDARRDATSRAYCYRILTRQARSVHQRGRALHWPQALDRAALDAGAQALVGTRDFTAFTPTETDHVRFSRDVFTARWTQPEAGQLEFWIEADSFMRHMNRVLVGTMLEVGTGHRSIESFRDLLEGAPRSQAGLTAPAHGLFLAGVGYGQRRVLAAK